MASKTTFVSDDSNEDLSHLRNFIRKKFLPALNSVSPNAQQNLLQLSKIARRRILKRAKKLGDRLPTGNISVIELADTEQLIDWQVRFFAKSRGYYAPSSKQIQEFVRQCLQSSTDRVPELSLGSLATIRRWGGFLHWIDYPSQLDFFGASNSVQEIYLDPDSQINLVLKYGRLKIKTRLTPVTLRIWDGVSGKYFRLGRDRPMKSVKKIAQTLRIPPWDRKTKPLISEDDVVIGWGEIDCRKSTQKLNALSWEWHFVPMQQDDISVS